MSLRTATDDCPVIYLSFTGYSYVTYQNTVISDFAIVSHVYIRHEEGVAADFCHALSAGLCATVDGDTFADGNIVTDLHVSNLSFELEVLRNSTYYRARIYLAILAHFHIRENDCVWLNLASVSDLYIVIDECVRSYLYVVSKNSLGTY